MLDIVKYPHTGGPWGASVAFDNEYPMRRVIAINSGGAVLAHVNCAFGNGGANARLIKAAPDLFSAAKSGHEALLALETFLRDNEVAIPIDILELCETACAKCQVTIAQVEAR